MTKKNKKISERTTKMYKVAISACVIVMVINNIYWYEIGKKTDVNSANAHKALDDTDDYMYDDTDDYMYIEEPEIDVEPEMENHAINIDKNFSLERYINKLYEFESNFNYRAISKDKYFGVCQMSDLLGRKYLGKKWYREKTDNYDQDRACILHQTHIIKSLLDKGMEISNISVYGSHQQGLSGYQKICDVKNGTPLPNNILRNVYNNISEEDRLKVSKMATMLWIRRTKRHIY